MGKTVDAIPWTPAQAVPACGERAATHFPKPFDRHGLASTQPCEINIKM